MLGLKDCAKWVFVADDGFCSSFYLHRGSAEQHSIGEGGLDEDVQLLIEAMRVVVGMVALVSVVMAVIAWLWRLLKLSWR